MISIHFFSLSVKAQEESGFLNSNYAGVNSLFVNPSYIVDSKIFIDVHLLGAHAFLHNNIAYVPKGSMPTFKNSDVAYELDARNVSKRAFAMAELMGPSIMASYGVHSGAVFTRFRNYVDAKVTKDLAFLFDKKFEYPSYVGKSFKEKAFVSAFSWAELGASYGYMYRYSDYETVDFGLSVKRIFGVYSSAFTLKDFDFTLLDSNLLYIERIKGSYRTNDPAWKAGKGWGFDIGINYQQKIRSVAGYEPNTKKNGCKHIDYKYRIGLALLDIGTLKMNTNARFRDFEFNLKDVVLDTSNLGSFSSFDKIISGSSAAPGFKYSEGSDFRVWLPFALSSQFDYNFENGIYINASYVGSIKIRNQPRRVEVISVTPRFQTKFFELAFPVSLVNYRYPQLGMALRLGNNFVIGSDRLDSFRGKIRNVYGADIYFHLKMSFFRRCANRDKAKFKSPRICPAYM